MKLSWKKVLTREYSFLYASYAIDALRIMHEVVGTTLQHDLFYGQGKLLTVYRVEEDVRDSYAMIEKIAKRNPSEIVERMDKFDELIKQDYKLLALIERTSDKQEIKKLLIELDEVFLLTLCYYLFFVYLGYAADLPYITKFLKKHGQRFAKIRTYTIDTDMNIRFPKLFGKYDRRLKGLTSFMSRRELLKVVNGKKINSKMILGRRKKYLVIMINHKVVEYGYSKIDSVLDKELSHLAAVLNENFVKGQIGCMGSVKGIARVIFKSQDYKKIKRGDIVVTPMTKPTIIHFLKKARAIVTNDGGALSHASIISREMNIPCVVGTIHATDIFKDGDLVEVDANKGIVRKI